MIVYVVNFSGSDTYFRCDHLPCSKVGAGRTGIGGDNVIRPPIGWVIPRRSGEIVDPNKQSEAYCSFECLAAHDDCPPESVEHIEAPIPPLVPASDLHEALTGARS